MQRHIRVLAGISLVIGAFALTAADRPASEAPQYTSDGRLQLPPNYREWVFLSSGLGMTYGPIGTGHVMFDNVFVNPSAYRSFLENGRWPDKTVLVLEARAAESKGSINRDGHFQSEIMAIETHVKDEKRFPRKWAFFGFRGTATVSEPAAGRASTCYTCHEPNGAVDTTFVQFYPTLMPIARAKGTFKTAP